MRTTRIAEIAALLGELDQRSPAGFAVALHIRFAAPTYLFQAYPRRWLEHYSAEGMVLHDPTVSWGLNNTGHIRWSELERIDRNGVLDRAKDFGLMNGIAMATVRSDSRSIASFSRADRDYHEEEVAELETIFFALHGAVAALQPLCEEERKALVDLSIQLTH